MKTLILILSTSALFAQQTYKVAATPKTVVIGAYTAGVPPVVKCKSGDTVEIQTVSGSANRLESQGAKGVQQELRDINEQVKERGPGGHILTGPVYIEGAEPGDVLEERIKKITLAVLY